MRDLLIDTGVTLRPVLEEDLVQGGRLHDDSVFSPRESRRPRKRSRGLNRGRRDRGVERGAVQNVYHGPVVTREEGPNGYLPRGWTHLIRDLISHPVTNANTPGRDPRAGDVRFGTFLYFHADNKAMPRLH